MTEIIAYKGGDADANKAYNFDLTTTLDQVRDTLTRDTFLPPDSDDGPQYRFVAAQAKTPGKKLKDAIYPLSIEDSVPLRKALRGGKGLLCTDINAVTKPDLIGIGTDWFFNRYLGVNIFLNNVDPEGAKQNLKVGAEKVLMLTNVLPTSERITGTFDNVCVVVENSVVGFNLSSWAAAGYQYSIASEQGDAIVDGLCICIGDKPNRYASAQQRRYQQDPATTIQIVGADTQKFGTSSVKFQKVTFRSRRISAYSQDGKSYQSDQKLPARSPTAAMAAATTDGADANAHALANAPSKGTSMVPGDSIKPGGPVPGPSSQQTFGTISDLKTDDWTEALGEVVVFFFVFKSLDDAKRVIDGYNAPDPNLWK